MTHVISIHSYRGGTGKSNVTANLAALVASQGKRVAVVDTDLQSPGIHTIFGLDTDTIGKTLNDFLWGRSSLSEAAYNVTQTIEGGAGEGQLFLIPASVDADAIARILSQGYDVSLLNDGFCEVIRKLKLDYLLIDTHPGLSKETFLSIAVSDLLLIILRPDRQDFQGTAVTIEVARQLNISKMLLVLNKVLARLDPVSLQQRVEHAYGLPIAGQLPMSEDLMHLGSTGLFCFNYPSHPLTHELKAIAQQLLSLGQNQPETILLNR